MMKSFTSLAVVNIRSVQRMEIFNVKCALKYFRQVPKYQRLKSMCLHQDRIHNLQVAYPSCDSLENENSFHSIS